ncbi:hypothetical protein F947_00067 [Acinetobacter towneri DSM 14962 = CIP 107472]|nr:hypothetical protein F947_00067 [Acinetobacter towneri DSM 14962 = CIP 107472]
MRRNVFRVLAGQYSVIYHFEYRAVALKHEYVLSRHHQCAEQQKGGIETDQVLQKRVFQSHLKLPGSARQSDHRLLTMRLLHWCTSTGEGLHYKWH